MLRILKNKEVIDPSHALLILLDSSTPYVLDILRQYYAFSNRWYWFPCQRIIRLYIASWRCSNVQRISLKAHALKKTSYCLYIHSQPPHTTPSRFHPLHCPRFIFEKCGITNGLCKREAQKRGKQLTQPSINFSSSVIICCVNTRIRRTKFFVYLPSLHFGPIWLDTF